MPTWCHQILEWLHPPSTVLEWLACPSSQFGSCDYAEQATHSRSSAFHFLPIHTSSITRTIPLFSRQSAGRGSFSFPVVNPWIWSWFALKYVRSKIRLAMESMKRCLDTADTAAIHGNQHHWLTETSSFAYLFDDLHDDMRNHPQYSHSGMIRSSPGTRIRYRWSNCHHTADSGNSSRNDLA